MPIFEFRCNSCGKSFEKLVRSQGYTARCTHCSGDNVDRILSVFGMSPNRGKSSSYTNSGSGCASCSGGSCSTCG